MLSDIFFVPSYNVFSGLTSAYFLSLIIPSRKTLLYVGGVLFIAVCYYVTVCLGMQLFSFKNSLAPIWPATGLGLAIILLFGYKWWPGIALGSLICPIITGLSPLSILGAVVGNVLEPVVAVYFIRKWGFDPALTHVRDVIVLGLYGAIVGPLLRSALGAAMLVVNGTETWSGFPLAMLTWWLGNSVGALAITPVLLSWKSPVTYHPPGKRLELVALIVAILASTKLVLDTLPMTQAQFAVEYLLFILLMWAGYRFGQRGSTSVALFAVSLAVFGTMNGYGPFIRSSPLETAFLLCGFMTVVSFFSMFFTALLTERRVAEEQVRVLNEELEERVQLRTAELLSAVKELESFSYSVSHDLRTPLRSINGFSYALSEDFGTTIPEGGKEYLHRIRRATTRMAEIIDDLLNLAKVSRASLSLSQVDVSALANEIIANLENTDLSRHVETKIQNGVTIVADKVLLYVALENLLSNAWKFTRHTTGARIEVGMEFREGRNIVFIRDNGAGFDMKFGEHLFRPFSRLHSLDQFEGSGIGLATVHKIILKHGGRIWAEAQPDRGATFFFHVR